MARSSPSPSSSSRSSATPPPTISVARKTKSLSSKSKNASASNNAGKNEGIDLNWAYAPPPDAVRIIEKGIDAGEFDWETVKEDEDLELWLIRVPETIKPKHLENLKVELNKSSQTACVGTLKRKHTAFDIWSVSDGDEQPVGGEEIKSISCLLPRTAKKGDLYPAPKSFARHLVVTAQPVKPTPTPPIAHQNPPRFSYPKEILKHRYVPYGSVDAEKGVEEENAMNVDTLPEPSTKPAVQSKSDAQEPPATEAETNSKLKKGKKRKGDVNMEETPKKKSKKSKVA